jgi:DNA-binding LacI/PurR family transcriptional regulator
VVGSDGLDLAAMTGPPLTTVAAPLAQIGAAALARLADLMATRDGPQRTVLQPALVPRSSTATPPPAPTTRHRPRS